MERLLLLRRSMYLRETATFRNLNCTDDFEVRRPGFYDNWIYSVSRACSSNIEAGEIKISTSIEKISR